MLMLCFKHSVHTHYFGTGFTRTFNRGSVMHAIFFAHNLASKKHSNPLPLYNHGSNQVKPPILTSEFSFGTYSTISDRYKFNNP